jgi:hypothetical protein
VVLTITKIKVSLGQGLLSIVVTDSTKVPRTELGTQQTHRMYYT